MKKSLRFKVLLAAVMIGLTYTFSACSGETQGNENTSPVATDAPETKTAAAETEPALSVETIIEHRDFNGADFNILGRSDGTHASLHAYELVAEELNGEVINDAVYLRNGKIEDYLNVKITAELADRAQQTSKLQGSVSAGDSAYDLAWCFLSNMTSMALGGYLTDMNAIPGMNPDADWWNKTITENMTIAGRLLLASNDIPFSTMLFTHCMFMNKSLAPSYGLDDIYDTVREGGWTLDALISATADGCRDLDGDGSFGDKDFYGFLSSYGAIGIFSTSGGQSVLSVSDDGAVTLEIFSDRMQSIVEKTYKLAFDNNSSYIVDNSLEPTIAKMFAAGSSLFYSGFFSDPLLYFRDMDDDFALIPFPKYDESQERYYTSISGGNGLLGVPKTIANPEMTGLVTEALALESYLSVRPAVLETVMVGKLLRDTASEEMFNLIQSGVRADFGFLYTTNGLGRVLRDLMQQKSTDLASYYASREANAQKYYEEVVAAYMGGE